MLSRPCSRRMEGRMGVVIAAVITDFVDPEMLIEIEADAVVD
jgi:hypothetical protein